MYCFALDFSLWPSLLLCLSVCVWVRICISRIVLFLSISILVICLNSLPLFLVGKSLFWPCLIFWVYGFIWNVHFFISWLVTFKGDVDITMTFFYIFWVRPLCFFFVLILYISLCISNCMCAYRFKTVTSQKMRFPMFIFCVFS